jgi:uncharacterized protein YggE
VTEQLPVISVRGEAWLEADPEIAVITVRVQARDRDRRAVLDRLVSRNRQVLDLVRGYGDAVEKVESGPASAHPELKPKGDKERVAGYAGQASRQAPVPGPGGWRAARMASAHVEEVPVLDLEPVRQPVTAQVDARFAMVLPGPSAP